MDEQCRTFFRCASVHHLVPIRGPDRTIKTRSRFTTLNRNACPAVSVVDPKLLAGICRLGRNSHSLAIGGNGRSEELLWFAQCAQYRSSAIHPCQLGVDSYTFFRVNQRSVAGDREHPVMKEGVILNISRNWEFCATQGKVRRVKLLSNQVAIPAE